MPNKSYTNNLFNTNRKKLYLAFLVIIILTFMMTLVYAALSTTLNINGNAEVSAASWDIYLDNVVLNSSSATDNIPTITDKTTASFTTTLSKPGDFYEFTIDIVNNGTIDAMIDSITKTPDLTATQSKYLNYTIEYINGESLNSKQLLSKNSFARLKVKIEFRKDITASDLPQTYETLNLTFKVNYIQSDSTSTPVVDDGLIKPKLENGSFNIIGSEVAIGDEHFYIISSDDNNVTMLSKYNLYVGGSYSNEWIAYDDEATGIQDSRMLGWNSSTSYKGVLKFSDSGYWKDTVSDYPADVYDSNSNLYSYIENYKSYLKSYGVNILDARLIKGDELVKLGCSYNDSKCSAAPKWVYSSSYWTATAFNSDNIRYINVWGGFVYRGYNNADYFGIRPVITVLTTEFSKN